MKILLVNPPVYDFSAYDVWIKPLGLLYLSSILKSFKVEVKLLDCLDRSHFDHIPSKPDGTGKFPATVIDKPDILKNIPLKYKRYGADRKIIENFFLGNRDADYLILTCSMTYWYPGVDEIIDIARQVLKKTKILLGGIYPTLASAHALYKFGCKVDHIFAGNYFGQLLEYLNITAERLNFATFPQPDYSDYKNIYYVVTRFSYGCHFNCIYCACRKIYPEYQRKNVHQFVQEIYDLYELTKCQNFVFYDDELLNPTTTELFYALLRLELPVKFYTPNGLNPKFITKEVAKLLYQLNFTDPRLSLETISDKTHNLVDKKITLKDFDVAVNNLLNAGYEPPEISVYILAGLPQESIDDVYHTIEVLSKYQLRIRLCELSPVPATKLYYQLGMDDTVDPLLHNNSIFIFNGVPGKVKPWCSYDELQQLKKTVKEINEKNSKQKAVNHLS